MQGAATDDWAGSALAAGDVNGDGVDDLVIGAPGSDSGGNLAGAVYVASGPLPTTSDLDDALVLVGSEVGGAAGTTVAVPGDLDGDGNADVAIGAPGSGAGRAYVVLGVDTALDLDFADTIVDGIDAGDAVGASVGAAGDLDNDGMPDLAVGASGRSLVGIFYSLPAGAVSIDLADVRFTSSTDSALGASVGNLGDQDGDGIDDVLLGAPAESTPATDAGAAWIVLGHGF